jgi:transcription-repair coupling factor (superfamily II helicase)
VAALDLEIRGAGNLLGGEQSGHIEAIGFEMYMKLLEEAVRELKGEEIEEDVRASVNLGIDIRIDDEYVPDMAQRLVVYRKVAAARSETEVTEVLDEIRDRYGPLPESVLNLAAYGRIRVMADQLGLESIDRQGSVVVLKFRDNAQKASHAPDPARMLAVLRRRPDITLTPPASLRLNLTMARVLPSTREQTERSLRTGPSTREQTERSLRAGPSTREQAERSLRAGPSTREQTERSLRTGRTPGYDAKHDALPSGVPKPRRSAAASWWTARATAGTVTPGFTKEEILKPPKEDPRAEGGLFDRVAGLLEDLLR